MPCARAGSRSPRTDRPTARAIACSPQVIPGAGTDVPWRLVRRPRSLRARRSGYLDDVHLNEAFPDRESATASGLLLRCGSRAAAGTAPSLYPGIWNAADTSGKSSPGDPLGRQIGGVSGSPTREGTRTCRLRLTAARCIAKTTPESRFRLGSARSIGSASCAVGPLPTAAAATLISLSPGNVAESTAVRPARAPDPSAVNAGRRGCLPGAGSRSVTCVAGALPGYVSCPRSPGPA